MASSTRLLKAYLGVGVTELDGNVTFELVLESNRLHSRDGLDGLRFSVSDVTDSSCKLEIGKRTLK